MEEETHEAFAIVTGGDGLIEFLALAKHSRLCGRP